METQTFDTKAQHNPDKISQEYLDDLIAAAERIEQGVASEKFSLVFAAYVTVRYGVVFDHHL